MVKVNIKYRSSFSPLIEELHQSLTPEDRIRLKNLIDKLTRDQLEKIEYEIHNLIFAYIKATPDERTSNPQWNKPDNPDLKLFLVYFSFLYLQRGYWMIEKINLVPEKNGHRDVVAAYASIAGDVKTKKFKETIFDDFFTFEEFNPKPIRKRRNT